MTRKLDPQFLKQFEHAVVGTKPMAENLFGVSRPNGRAERSALIGSGNNNDSPFKLPPPPSITRKKPTIIRTSKSSENIVDLENSGVSHSMVNRNRQLFEGGGDHSLGHQTRNGGHNFGGGAMYNPGFLLESKKTRAAPGVPSNMMKSVIRGGGNPPPPPKPKKPGAPPRPSCKPGGPRQLHHGNVAWHKSTNDIDLLSFDPLFDQSEPSASTAHRSEAVNITNELEAVFSKRMPNSSSAFSIGHPEPAKQRHVDHIDWSVGGHAANSESNTVVSTPVPRKNSAGAGLTEPHAIALYDYESTTAGDLCFQSGDRIRLLKTIDTEWSSGYNSRTWKEGIFPVSYVNIRVPLLSTHTPPSAATHKPEVAPRVPVASGGGISVAQRASNFSKHTEHKPRRRGYRQLPELPDSPPPIKPYLTESIKSPPKHVTSPFLDNTSTTPVSLRDRPLPPPPPASPGGAGGELQKARALYDYNSGAADDLQFSTGDILVVTETVDSNWLRGRHDSMLHRREGMFPVTFVELIGPPPVANHSSGISGGLATLINSRKEPETTARTSNRTSNSHRRSSGLVNGNKTVSSEKRYWAFASFDFPSSEKEDLSFKTGDKIHVTGSLNADWLTGETENRRKGQFPASFIRRATPSEVENISRHRPQGRAIYDFPAETSGDLKLEAGCTVFLLEKVDDDWYRGELQSSGQVGIFPTSFVRVTVPLS